MTERLAGLGDREIAEIGRKRGEGRGKDRLVELGEGGVAGERL